MGLLKIYFDLLLQPAQNSIWIARFSLKTNASHSMILEDIPGVPYMTAGLKSVPDNYVFGLIASALNTLTVCLLLLLLLYTRCNPFFKGTY